MDTTMSIPQVKRLQLLGSLIMLAALVNQGVGQSLMLLSGSLLILASMLIRMYIIHILFKIPVARNLLNYVLIPMSTFLLVNGLLEFQPAGIQPGMWYYLLIWSSAVMGISVFIQTITRRLLARAWYKPKQR